MNNEELEKQQENAFIKKLKKVDTKKVSRGIVIFFFLFAIVFGTITNLTFGEFNPYTWASSTLILSGIMVFGLFMGEGIGNDRFKALTNGLYQTMLKRYKEIKDKVDNQINHFTQWYCWKVPNELISKKKTFLVENGLTYEQAEGIVLYCHIEDLEVLKNKPLNKEVNEKNIFIEKLEQYQIPAVKYVLSGEFKLDIPNAGHFLTATSSTSEDLSIFERGKALSSEAKSVKRISRIIKISSSAVISLVFSLLTVREMMSGDDVQAWVNLISRITAFVTSLFTGFLSMKKVVNILAQVIENKVIVLDLFKKDIEQKVFVPKTHEQDIILENKIDSVDNKLQNSNKNVENKEGTL